MAISLQGPKVWFVNSAAIDTRAFDLERLSNGSFLVAFGGSSGTNAALHTGVVSTATWKLGALDSTTWTPTNFAGTVRKLEVTAGSNGTGLVTLHSTYSSAGGPDSNFSLVTLPTSGGVQRNVAPLPVNPGGAAEATHDAFATVHLRGGGFIVYFTEPGTDGYADLSNGIRAARFDETGARLGTTRTVIGETIVNPMMNLENNPEAPDAVQLGNGNIGLFYKENLGNGFPRFLFQELTVTGAKVGGALEIGQGGIRPAITALDNGNTLLSWFDPVAGQHKARMMNANGDLSGAAFGISTGEQAPYSAGSVVALQDGFAFSWRDTDSGLWLGQTFDLTGHARSNPFLVTDSAGDFRTDGTTGGLERAGSGFVGFVLGVKANSFTTTLEGQLFSGASSLGLRRVGTTANETLHGGTKDDRIFLGSGNDQSNAGDGNDVQYGGAGADTIWGGAGFDRVDGGSGNDVISGGLGTDILLGGTGNDRISGSSGADRLTGGLGRDTLSGGTGADMFIFSGPSDSLTTVSDFHASEGDKLKIKVTDYGYLGIFGPEHGTNPNPTSSGLYFNTATHILSNDRDGAGTLYARVNIAYLPDVTTITLNDLVTF